MRLSNQQRFHEIKAVFIQIKWDLALDVRIVLPFPLNLSLYAKLSRCWWRESEWYSLSHLGDKVCPTMSNYSFKVFEENTLNTYRTMRWLHFSIRTQYLSKCGFITKTNIGIHLQKPSLSFQSLVWFIFPDTDSDRCPSASCISVKYLMCSRLLLMPSFAANRSEQSRRGGSCVERKKFSVRGEGMTKVKQTDMRRRRRGALNLHRFKLGFVIDKNVSRLILTSFRLKLQPFFFFNPEIVLNAFIFRPKHFQKMWKYSVWHSWQSVKSLIVLQAGTHSASAFGLKKMGRESFVSIFTLKPSAHFGLEWSSKESEVAVNGWGVK